MRQNRSNKQKRTTIILSAVLALVVLIGGTLALLTVPTNKEANKFGVKVIKARLFEDAWTPAVATSALTMVPGTALNKDPLIKNVDEQGNAGQEDIYVAIKVSLYQGKDGGAGVGDKLTPASDEFKLVAKYLHFYDDDKDVVTKSAVNILGSTSGQTITTANGTWECKGLDTEGTSLIYIYSEKLAPSAASDNLFKSIALDKDLETADNAKLAALEGFEVYLEGYAVQANGVDESTAKGELLDAAKVTSP